MIAIRGNTYPVKEQLKALGGQWNAARKAWMVPDDKAQEAERIVASAGPKPERPYPGPKSSADYDGVLDEWDGYCQHPERFKKEGE